MHVARTDDSETVRLDSQGRPGGSRLPRHGSGLAFNPAPIFLPSGISSEERAQPDQPTWVQRELGA